MSSQSPPKVVALSGGVGGAKLALGLHRILPPGELMIVVNTGDDFEHLGLHISPDIDTLLYTLAGIANPVLGWGLHDETWNFMAALKRLGGADWFQLGDMDLATHVERTRRLRAGETLSRITSDFACKLGITSRIVPMSDDAVRTYVQSHDTWYSFQSYFVERRCAPVVTRLEYRDADRAAPHPEIVAALRDSALRAVILCPSNPFLSLDPILSIAGMRDLLRQARAPVVAISPIVGGTSIKGPTAKLMQEFGLKVDVATVAQHYADLIDAIVVDPADRADADRISTPVMFAPALMQTLEDRENLARAALDAADRCI